MFFGYEAHNIPIRVRKFLLVSSNTLFYHCQNMRKLARRATRTFSKLLYLFRASRRFRVGFSRDHREQGKRLTFRFGFRVCVYSAVVASLVACIFAVALVCFAMMALVIVASNVRRPRRHKETFLLIR